MPDTDFPAADSIFMRQTAESVENELLFNRFADIFLFGAHRIWLCIGAIFHNPERAVQAASEAELNSFRTAIALRIAAGISKHRCFIIALCAAKACMGAPGISRELFAAANEAAAKAPFCSDGFKEGLLSGFYGSFHRQSGATFGMPNTDMPADKTRPIGSVNFCSLFRSAHQPNPAK